VHVQPLVSVVTPVYNGEKHLSECIESVLAQTYNSWEYVIVNNCSTDRSLEIANHYAAKDERIRIHNNKEFFELIANWNHTINQISPKCKYFKVVHADDWLYPECIEQMVRIAEMEPSISIVGSYVLKGLRVEGSGLPYPNFIFPGKEICRQTLLRKFYVFGSPTSLLIRSDQIRKQNKFYNECFIHADKEVCLRILQNSDFGFVHQILSYTRLHDESQTDTVVKKYRTDKAENLGLFFKYGPVYFNRREYDKFVKNQLKNYYRYLAKNFIKFKGIRLFKKHKYVFKKLEYSMSPVRLITAFFEEIIDWIFNPKKTIGLLIRSAISIFKTKTSSRHSINK
jgi:glycosyltransferase involved in cell wall biosynthesis